MKSAANTSPLIDSPRPLSGPRISVGSAWWMCSVGPYCLAAAPAAIRKAQTIIPPRNAFASSARCPALTLRSDGTAGAATAAGSIAESAVRMVRNADHVDPVGGAEHRPEPRPLQPLDRRVQMHDHRAGVGPAQRTGQIRRLSRPQDPIVVLELLRRVLLEPAV